jgi:hypothetical protein
LTLSAVDAFAVEVLLKDGENLFEGERKPRRLGRSEHAIDMLHQFLVAVVDDVVRGHHFFSGSIGERGAMIRSANCRNCSARVICSAVSSRVTFRALP